MTIGESTKGAMGRTAKVVRSPVGELRSYLADFVTRCRAARWFGALFHAQVAEDIASEVEQAERASAQEAYAIQQSEGQAQSEIRAFETDGDRQHLDRALRIARRNEQRGRDIAEALA